MMIKVLTGGGCSIDISILTPIYNVDEIAKDIEQANLLKYYDNQYQQYWLTCAVHNVIKKYVWDD